MKNELKFKVEIENNCEELKMVHLTYSQSYSKTENRERELVLGGYSKREGLTARFEEGRIVRLVYCTKDKRIHWKLKTESGEIKDKSVITSIDYEINKMIHGSYDLQILDLSDAIKEYEGRKKSDPSEG